MRENNWPESSQLVKPRINTCTPVLWLQTEGSFHGLCHLWFKSLQLNKPHICSGPGPGLKLGSNRQMKQGSGCQEAIVQWRNEQRCTPDLIGAMAMGAADPKEYFCQVISLKISRNRTFLYFRSCSKDREVEQLFHSWSEISKTWPKQDLQTSEAVFLLQGPAPTLTVLPGPGEGPWTNGS